MTPSFDCPSVVRLLDAAGDAAWEARSKDAAIRAAWSALHAGGRPEMAAAFIFWGRAVDFTGDPTELGDVLRARYRDRGDIALSLKRAALMAEQQMAERGAS